MTDDTKALVADARKWAKEMHSGRYTETLLLACVDVIERLEHELAQAREDAERYRWLRNCNSDVIYFAPAGYDASEWARFEFAWKEQLWQKYDPVRLDAAIDAARAKELG